MTTDARFHRRSNPKSLVNSAEIVVHVKQRDHRNVVLDLLGKGVSQPGKASHVHPHVEILSLYVAGADVRVIWLADDIDTLGHCCPN